jgi:hypothetical protein
MSLDDNLYDRSGQPIDFERWVMLFSDARYQVLRQTDVGNVTVSTVWLGADMSIEREPLIFETMVFGVGREECYRYTEETLALAHHDKLVAELRLLASVE